MSITKCLQRCVNFVLIPIGWRIDLIQRDSLLDFDYGKEALSLIPLIKPNTMLSNANLVTLYEQAAYCAINGLDGDFVECGVWKGGAVGMMALAAKRYENSKRIIHLFDSFDNICEPQPAIDGAKAMDEMKHLSNENPADWNGKLRPVDGVYDSHGGPGTIEVCKELICNQLHYPLENVRFYKGWFQNTIPDNIHLIQKIALLRLDADWYASTKICLDLLYDKVIPGGLIIIDDYGRYDGCRKAVDEFLRARNIKTFLSYSNNECRFFVKP